MFILRIVTNEQGIENIHLGEQFTVINNQLNEPTFKGICKEQGFNESSFYGIVRYKNSYYPLSKSKKDVLLKYYIVTENGNTYEKL